MTHLDPTIAELKRLIIGSLHLEDVAADDIDPDAPLFGEGLGLDSVDALELVVALEKHYGIRTESHEIGREAFASVRALAAFVRDRKSSDGAAHA